MQTIMQAHLCASKKMANSELTQSVLTESTMTHSPGWHLKPAAQHLHERISHRNISIVMGRIGMTKGQGVGTSVPSIS